MFVCLNCLFILHALLFCLLSLPLVAFDNGTPWTFHLNFSTKMSSLSVFVSCVSNFQGANDHFSGSQTSSKIVLYLLDVDYDCIGSWSLPYIYLM